MGNANSVTQSLYEKYIRPNSSQQTTSPKGKANQSMTINSNTPVTDQLVEKYIKKTGSGSTSAKQDTVVPKSVLLPTVAGTTPSTVSFKETADSLGAGSHRVPATEVALEKSCRFL